MATRMQQRRGTATQWTTANPVLAAGEIGFEIDTYKFKIGDGINQWDDLDYFGASDDVLASIINAAPETLDTLGEIANALGNNPAFANSFLTHTNATLNVHGISNTAALLTIEHETDTSNVHGIANTLALATQTDVNNAIASAESYTDDEIIAHNLLTENVHGISNTLMLATKDYVSNAAGSGIQWNAIDEQFDLDATIATEEYATNAIATHNALTLNVHGISNTLALATKTEVDNAQTAAQSAASSALSSHNSATANVHGIADTTALATKSYADSAVSTHNSVTTNVHGIANTAALITNSGNQTIDGILTLSGLIVNGNTTTVSTVDLTVEDPMINLSSEQYTSDLVDIGVHGSYGTAGGNATSHSHTGLVRDVTDKRWKLFSNVPVPVANEINFTNAVYDDLVIGSLRPTVGVVFTDGTQTKEGVPSRTTIVQATGAYNLSTGGLSLRDSLIEVDHTGGSAVNVTIPADSTTNYPIGTSIDVVRTNTGAVTIAGAGGVTVNATPGLNLRARWSSVTLFKRAANTWLVMGDLSA